VAQTSTYATDCSWKALGVLREYGVNGCLLLAVNSLYSSSEDCDRVDGVKSQSFSVGVGLREWFVPSPLLFIVYVRVLHTHGPRVNIRPAKPFHPAAKHILPMMKKYFIYKECVDLLECDISRKNHITQDVRPSNCCPIACVVLWRNGSFQRP